MIVKRFIEFYKPHMNLFVLDMSVAFLAAVLSIFFPMLTRQLLKIQIPNHNLEAIILTLALMLSLIFLKSICTFIRIKWGHVLGVRMEYDMRENLFSHIQKLSFNYFDNVKTGHIMSRISNDLNLITEMAHHAPEDLVISLFMIIGAFGMMFSFNTELALLSLVPMPLLLVWGATYGMRMRNGFRMVRRRIADINSSVENSVQGIREVKSYANESLELRKFSEVNGNFRTAKETIYAMMAKFHSGMNFLTDFYYVWVVGAGVFLIFQGKVDVADLIAFTLYINFIMDPISRLVNFMEQFQEGTASFERFTEIMDIEPDIKDRKNAFELKHVNGELRIENLWFRYQNMTEWVLKNINIQIPAGKNVAIVGESGAGKSTLVSLIPRFYEAEKGKITLDGSDIFDLKQAFLRESIGIVQQNIFLFDTSIRDNILYGKPDSTEAELIEAARKANILDFIHTLPDGFDTLVGERGVKLSGGQKQRVSIARVFLKNPPVLIFDEATSSLDNESEALIQQSMELLSQNRTTIVIAHRLSTVKKANLIYVMNKGEIIEIGGHEELIQAQGYYYNLYNRNLL